MAHANKKEVPTIFLELSMDEAEVLRALCQATTGNCTRRRLADDIDTALYEADVLNSITVVGSVRFRDETDDDDDLPF